MAAALSAGSDTAAPTAAGPDRRGRRGGGGRRLRHHRDHQLRPPEGPEPIRDASGATRTTVAACTTFQSDLRRALFAAPPPPGALNGLLLSVDQINTAMNTTGMSSVGTMSAMPDNSSFVSDQACLALSAAVQARAYAGSGYSAVQAQVVAKPQQNTVNQAVVSFPSTQDAASFFTASTRSWQACSNRQFTLAANGNSQEQTVGPVSNTNGMLSATVTPANSVGVCERALHRGQQCRCRRHHMHGPAGCRGQHRPPDRRQSALGRTAGLALGRRSGGCRWRPFHR